MVSAAGPLHQGDIVWADLGEPRGSKAAYRRPVLIIQGNAINRSRIATVICIPLTSNVRLAAMPGNLLLKARETGLDRDCVANMSLITAIDRAALEETISSISERRLLAIFSGLDLLLGR
jgi:mRNA interferase MazF